MAIGAELDFVNAVVFGLGLGEDLFPGFFAIDLNWLEEAESTSTGVNAANFQNFSAGAGELFDLALEPSAQIEFRNFQVKLFHEHLTDIIDPGVNDHMSAVIELRLLQVDNDKWLTPQVNLIRHVIGRWNR